MAHSFHRARPLGVTARSAFTFGGVVNRVTAWNEARRTRNALSKLSVHELEDIGLHRGDIDRIAGDRF